MTMDQTCEARVSPKAGGYRCQFAARHTHTTQQGRTMQLCNLHLRTIKRRERLGSDDELVARWLDEPE